MPLEPLTSLVTATLPEGTDFELTRERANDVWSELSPVFDFRQLEVGDENAYVRCFTGSEVNGLLLQPPFVQFGLLASQGAETETDAVARKTESLFSAIARIAGVEHFNDARARQIYEVPVSDEDGSARTLIDHRLIGLGDDEPTSLHGPDGWSSLRFVVPGESGEYVVTIEPRHYGAMKRLYVEADAGFAGDAPPASFSDRIRGVRNHVEGPIATFVDKLLAG